MMLPHLVVLSATPIPRTLALTVYGDLDLVTLDELPPGRRPVRTEVLVGPQERQQAPILSQALFAAQAAVRNGERDAEKLRRDIEARIRGVSLAVVGYVAVCDADTLEPLTRISRRAVALVAARFGATRLIDNVVLDV